MSRKSVFNIIFLLSLLFHLIACQSSGHSKWDIKPFVPGDSALRVKHFDQTAVVSWAESMTYGDDKITNYVAIDTLLMERCDYNDFLTEQSNKTRNLYVEDMILLGALSPDSLIDEVDRWLLSSSLDATSPLSVRDTNIKYLLKDIFHEDELADFAYTKDIFSFTSGSYTSIRSEKSYMTCGVDAAYSYDIYRENKFIARVRVYGFRNNLLVKQESLEMEGFVWDSLAMAFGYSVNTNRKLQNASAEE